MQWSTVIVLDTMGSHGGVSITENVFVLRLGVRGSSSMGAAATRPGRGRELVWESLHSVVITSAYAGVHASPLALGTAVVHLAMVSTGVHRAGRWHLSSFWLVVMSSRCWGVPVRYLTRF